MTKPRGTAPTMTAKQAFELGAAVQRQLPDMDPVVAQQWIEKQGALNEFLKGLADGPQNSFPTITVTVDHSLSVEEMVAAGRYDWANESITQEHFSHDRAGGKQEVVVHIVQYDKWMSSEDVERDFDSRGLRVATNAVVLALGAQCPELQRENPIVGLGSRWRDPFDFVYVPVLREIGGERELNLSWYEGPWRQHVRFAAVSK